MVHLLLASLAAASSIAGAELTMGSGSGCTTDANCFQHRRSASCMPCRDPWQHNWTANACSEALPTGRCHTYGCTDAACTAHGNLIQSCQCLPFDCAKRDIYWPPINWTSAKPKYLMVGDSISIQMAGIVGRYYPNGSHTPGMNASNDGAFGMLRNSTECTHSPNNAANSNKGAHCVETWLAQLEAPRGGGCRLDRISFNFGIHDCNRLPGGFLAPDNVPLADYKTEGWRAMAAHLASAVLRLKTDEATDLAGAVTLSNEAGILASNGRPVIAGEANNLCHEGTWYLYFNNWGTCPGVDCCGTDVPGWGKGCASCCYKTPPHPYIAGCASPLNGSSPYGIYHQIHAYKTTDWKRFDDLGVVLSVADRQLGTIFRPHVIFNKKNGNFLMWYGSQSSNASDGNKPEGPFGYNVALSASPAGPFKEQHVDVPVAGNLHSGDFDLFVEDDGAAYIIFTSYHFMNITRLNDDFTAGSGPALSGFAMPKPGEGPVLFKRKALYYALSGTGCCGCIGGSSIYVQTASSLAGPWSYRGDVGSNKSQPFNPRSPLNYVTHAQASTVAQLPLSSGEIAYLWIGNQWNSGFLSSPPKPQQSHNQDLLYFAALQFDKSSGDVVQLEREPNVTLVLKTDETEAAASNFNLNGLWTFALIAGQWSNTPALYNISHDVTSGAVSFPGYSFSDDLTWRPSDAFSKASGQLKADGSLTLTLHDVGRKAGATVIVRGSVHKSCDFIDMEGSPYNSCATVPPPEAVSSSYFWPAALAATAAEEAPSDTNANCSTLPGPQCYTPKGQAVKCSCKGSDVCGCPAATKACKPCFKCTECAGPPQPKPPAPPPPPPLVGGFFCRGGSPIDMKPSAWIKFANAWLLRAATICSTDGKNVSLLTPGFPLGYRGQWMRDSYYGISNGLDLLPNVTKTIESVEWMFEHARPVDGALPQSVAPSGANDTFYEWGQRCNQSVGAPLWRSCIDLDSGPFGVKLAAAVMSTMTSAGRMSFVTKWERVLANGLNVTTLDPNGSGLPWINSSRQLIGYGFQDGEYMSGDVLYSSILYWNASGILADLYAEAGASYAPREAAMRKQAAHVKTQITMELWSEKLGAFIAATELESDRISIWGNAFAGASGLASKAQADKIFSLFKTRERDIFWEGQVRQTPAPQFWASTHTGPHTYQDGGYWGTPLHHCLSFIGSYDKQMACRLLHDSIASYRSHGVNEWSGPYYPAKVQGAAGYVASAAGSYFGSKALQCPE